jgi:hypothetical protein
MENSGVDFWKHTDEVLNEKVTLHDQQLINLRMCYFPDTRPFLSLKMSENEEQIHCQKAYSDEWNEELRGKLGVGIVNREVLMHGLKRHIDRMKST